MTLTFIQSHTCIRNKNKAKKKKPSTVHFLVNVNIDLEKFQYVATTCWFVEAHAKFIICTNDIEVENSAGVIL